MSNIKLSDVRNNMNSLMLGLKMRAKELKKSLVLLYRAYKHKETPWYAKALIIATIAYAVSPIDLIPDFVPVLGYLDDLVILPAAITLSIKLIPKEIIEQCKQLREENENLKSKGIYAAVFIVIIWVGIIFFILNALSII